MYSYKYSAKTGGLLLNSTPTGFSKEPRPVYAAELNLLGFQQYWQYDNQNDEPYMWAEANRYYYRGRLVASLLGGDVYHAPVIQLAYTCPDWREVPKGKAIRRTICENPEDKGESFTDKKGNIFKLDLPEPGANLRPVDITAMIDDNREILGWLEETTAKKILEIYEKYVDKLDIFHVAFSGGKDSCVLLDLVKSVLPHDSFVVVFGDTGMEFPDTYDVIDKVEAQCKKDGVKFYRASSHLTPAESWDLFAPPSCVLRWCCSVHKSTPQTLKLREITGKRNYTGLAYVGVRSEESATRSEYEYENSGKKIKGQYSHNSILEWTSAEIWLYIYAHNLIINEAYKKGNSRAGCIFCPMSVNKSDYIKYRIYPNEVDLYINMINEKSGRNFGSGSYVSRGGWVSRRSGRDVIGNTMNYSETLKNDMLSITVTNAKTDWREWFKTIEGFDNIPYTFTEKKDGYTVELAASYIKKDPKLGKVFKQVFKKSAYCVGCKVCETNCQWGCLNFDNGLKISDCMHCLKCHDIEDGCLAYNSLKIPTEGKSMSINCFDSVLPKNNWFIRFFEEKNEFWNAHGLGPNQLKTFKRFLRDSGLIVKSDFTQLAELIETIGWETETSWGIILVNLVADNPQICWYVSNFDVGQLYPKDTVISMLLESNSSKNVVKFVYNAFGKLVELPLGTKLNFGYVS
ncbi:MAG: phosphoadenosine phosphosulfate reductase family protein, partial [Dysgonamonadaceae bacterium]|nr:phosphoadenosine phosphosulfate reductase family protein [Dysgonamonadaceae bacterium]